ncbi:hypothetical protein POTOM_016968 [Populus tomentosa]|uniref:Uncharacterized protein n=1 Tax=Populus tomentosa TaxID=118781 RepID=A0A8X7ZWA9_POPTO|nr:hypothetical protein POTOM_016968 [Populus tomentosa]
MDSPVNPPTIGAKSSSHSAEKQFKEQPPTKGTSRNTWMYVLIIPIEGILIIVVGGLLFTCRKQGVTTIGPRKTGLCGQLQKAFVKGDI